jgi:hypothetical protein
MEVSAMNAAPSMTCTRCNGLSSDAETCSKCGTRLKTLQSQQRRGWVALGAGVFLVVFMAAIWIWVDGLLAGNAPGQRDAATAQFEGRINVAFALVVVAGMLGTINGWLMVRTGLRNRMLIFGLIIVFVSALFVACSASSGYRP